MAIGTYIRQQRHKKNMSQTFLADLVGVSQSTISNWESEASHPDCEEIKKIAQKLDVPLEDLLADDTRVLKVIQQNQDHSHTNHQHIHPAGQTPLIEQLLAAKDDLIAQLKAHVSTLEAENARLRPTA